MNRSIFIAIATLAVSFTITGALFVAPPAAAQSPGSEPSSLASTPTPTPASTGGLCGVGQADVADIANYYSLDLDMEAVTDALETPFNCEAYDELCLALPPAQAHEYACGVWQDLMEHRSMQAVSTRALDRLTSESESCNPNASFCANICDPNGVESCSGIWIGSRCLTIAVCELPMLGHIEGFKSIEFESAF